MLLVVPDVVLDRLARWFKPDRVCAAIDRPAPLFGGKSACDFVRDGGSWEEVLTRYERLFAYAVTA